jgi:large subunit ribosomal protein L25
MNPQGATVAERITLKLERRDTLGKKVKHLRRSGIVPVHLYGWGIDPHSLQCQRPTLIKVLARAGGNTPITVTIEGDREEHLAFVREVQWDPIRGDLFHVDFLRIAADQRITAQVPITLTGQSPAAIAVNGSVVRGLRTLEVEALPMDMPAGLVVDLTTLTEPGGIIRASDILLPPNTTLASDPDDVVARIEVAKAEEVVEKAPVEEGAEAPAEEPQEEGGPQREGERG